MPIKSILVAYSGEARGSGGLNFALQLAKQHGAHLTGVVSHGPSFLETQYKKYHFSDDVLNLLRNRDSEAVGELRAEFDAHMADNGCVQSEFLDLHASEGSTLTEIARGYDVTVMGRRASEPGREHFGVRPEEIALNSGRPVILVPRSYDAAALSNHAMIAWDGKRSAARALGDAMPLLEKMDAVSLASVVSDGSGVPLGSEIVALLGKHGIKADQVARAPDGETVTGRLLSLCDELGAGLLVMGAYQHSRLREDIFGGVTRDIMEAASLPVFMSH